jgi:pumilio family protein 6
LQGGHFNHSLKSVEPCASWNPFAFAVQFVDTVGNDDGQTIKDVCIKGDRNGTFVVAELCGALVKAPSDDGKAEEGKEVRKKLKLWLTAPEMLKEIHEGEATGVRGVKVLVDAVGTL